MEERSIKKYASLFFTSLSCTALLKEINSRKYASNIKSRYRWNPIKDELFLSYHLNAVPTWSAVIPFIWQTL